MQLISTGGSARESNPPTPLVTRHNGFEEAPVDINDDQLLTEFLQDRQARGVSRQTYRFYQGYLVRFVNGVDRPLLALRRADINNFLNTRDCNPGGKHAYFRVIRAFYKWACEEGYIDNPPKLSAPKVPKPIRPAVSLDDVNTLLSACETGRDRLIVSMLADTGLRRSELIGVDVDDIDLNRQVIKVWGKGAKERIVRYGPRTQDLLTKWLEVRPESHSLFGLEGIGLTCVLKRLKEKTGIICNAHAFRRTFAIESIRNGMNPFYVQSLLGHEDLKMTRVYAEQVNSEDAIKAYKPIVT